MNLTGTICKRTLISGLLVLLLILVNQGALSATTRELFDGGESSKVFSQEDVPSVTLPSGAVIFNASVDLMGFSSNPGQNLLLNFLDTETSGWHGHSLEDPPISVPAKFENYAFNAKQCDDMEKSDGVYTRTIAGNWNMSGPYQHFAFEVPYSADVISNLEVCWRGRGEEPLIDSIDRFKADIYAWNDHKSVWEKLDSYGLVGTYDFQWLSDNITSDFGHYLDVNEKFHLLVRAWVQGTYEAYIDTDYVCLNVTFEGTGEFPLNPSLTLEDGGEVVWNHNGLFSSLVTLGNDILREPIQQMSDLASGSREGDFTVEFLLDIANDGNIELSNLSIEYGLGPSGPANEITTSFPEDTDPVSLIDLRDHFTDDEDVSGLTFEVIHEEDPDKVHGYMESDGHTMSFNSTMDHWYGTLGFGVRVTDGDGLFSEFHGINVTVEPENDRPVALGIPDQYWREDRECPEDFLDLWPYFEDGGWHEDSVDNFTFRLPPALNPGYMDLTAIGIIRENRYFTCSSPKNFTGNVTFTVEASDPEGESVQDSFILHILEQNDPPLFNSTPPDEVNENANYSYSIEVYDMDTKGLIISLEEGPDDMVLADNQLYWIPGDHDVGQHNVSLSVTDGANKTFQNFSVRVNNVNDAPTITPLGAREVLIGEVLNVTVMALDADMEFDDSEKLTFTDDTGLFDIDYEKGSIYYQPHWTQVGSYSVEIVVSDRLGTQAKMDFTLNVSYPLGMDDPEIVIMSPDGTISIAAGEPVSMSAGIENDEVSDNWNFTWSVDGDVIGYGLEFTYTFQKAGEFRLEVKAIDGTGEVEDHMDITVVKARKESSGSGGYTMGMIVIPIIVILIIVVLLIMFIKRKKPKVEEEGIKGNEKTSVEGMQNQSPTPQVTTQQIQPQGTAVQPQNGYGEAEPVPIGAMGTFPGVTPQQQLNPAGFEEYQTSSAPSGQTEYGLGPLAPLPPITTQTSPAQQVSNVPTGQLPPAFPAQQLQLPQAPAKGLGDASSHATVAPQEQMSLPKLPQILNQNGVG